MFFSKPGVYKPCGIFNTKHLILFIITTLIIAIAAKFTNIKKKENVRRVIRILTANVWILEIVRIVYLIAVGEGAQINRTVPLYYCSLLLYAGLLSSIGKGALKRAGDVFLATGSIIGGLVFLIFPTTSLPEYPMFHFISLHSFLFHGIMIYLGIIINKSKYIELSLADLKYYAGLVAIVCALACVVNLKFGSNLMFISQDFPGTLISNVYKDTKGPLFTLIMCSIQMTVPFLMIYGILQLKTISVKRLCNTK